MEKKSDIEVVVWRDGVPVSKASVNEAHRGEGGPPLVTVRVDVLIPFLVYARKLFDKLQSTERNTPSRFVDPEDFELTMKLRGFTPEDFNALQSLCNTMGTDLAALLDEMGEGTPQMSRTKLDPRELSGRPSAKLRLPVKT